MAVVDNSRDSFPIGMRVLAVDDNPTCLRILEALLKKCQYHVTASKSAIMALQLLRENKEKFDLVISDVHMPDMDGFKLLELVGLEMDLPVIMLSVNDDPGMVMKGIHHGACDYLLKPIRIEALKTIWRHVVRPKKVDSKEQNKNSNQDKPDSGSCNGLGSSATEGSEQNGQPTKKRKDQDEDDDEDHENGNDNDDSSSQKKPRVVWSVDLHRKFVSAVNQLGIDKAVPKKILDLMNDEKLTRENVASHLQKYRLYLKKANTMASPSGSDSSYYSRTSSLSGFGHLHTLSGSSQFHSNGFRSLSPGGMTTSRFNTPSGLNLHGLNFAGTRPFGQALTLNNSGNDQQFQSPFARSNQNFLSGGLDPLQQNKGVSSVQNLNSTLYDYNYDYKPSFPISNRLADQGLKVTMGGSNNVFMLEQTPRATQGVGAYDTPTSELCSPSLDHGRSSDIFSTPLPSSYPSSEYFMPSAIPPTNNMTPTTTFQGGNLSGASSITSLSSQSPDSFTDMHSQGLTFTNNNNPGQISNNVPFPGWDDHNQNASYNSNVIGSSMNSLTPMNGGIDHEGHAPSNYTFNRNLDSDFDLFQLNHGGTGALTDEKPPKPLQLYTMNQQKSHYSRISSGHGSLEDLVSEIMKQKPDKVKLSDEDYLFDNYYPGGTAM